MIWLLSELSSRNPRGGVSLEILAWEFSVGCFFCGYCLMYGLMFMLGLNYGVSHLLLIYLEGVSKLNSLF